MKLTSLFLVVSSFLTVSAFGVSPSVVRSTSTGVVVTQKPPLANAAASPLFRAAVQTRGGAVPGWAAYNEALDKKPLVTKAMTSLVGWALGDLLAQVCGR